MSKGERGGGLGDGNESGEGNKTKNKRKEGKGGTKIVGVGRVRKG